MPSLREKKRSSREKRNKMSSGKKKKKKMSSSEESAACREVCEEEGIHIVTSASQHALPPEHKIILSTARNLKSVSYENFENLDDEIYAERFRLEILSCIRNLLQKVDKGYGENEDVWKDFYFTVIADRINRETAW